MVSGGQAAEGRRGPGDAEGVRDGQRIAHNARVWNYWLGGKDHYAVDAEVGEQVAGFHPGIRDVARADRASPAGPRLSFLSVEHAELFVTSGGGRVRFPSRVRARSYGPRQNGAPPGLG